MKTTLCLLAAPLAAGLVAPQPARQATALGAAAGKALEGMSGGVQAGDPMPGQGAWDPMGFSNIFDMIQGSEHAGVFPSPVWMREVRPRRGSKPFMLYAARSAVRGGPRDARPSGFGRIWPR